MNPLVSVAVGVYNVERYIKPAVESVLNQTYGHLELVVVDDGSTDGTVARLEEVRDPRLTVVRCAHRGSAPTRNEAIRRTTGKYVGLLDGDDLYLPGKLERHIEFLESSPKTDVSFSRFQSIDEDGIEMGVPSRPPEQPLSFETLLVGFPVNGSSAVVRRSAFETAGLFDEELPSCLDLDLWLRLALVRDGNLHCVPEILTLYRRRRGQITGDWRRMERGWNMMLRKMGSLVPSRTGAVYQQAAAHWYWYLAYLADSQGDRRAALKCLGRSVQFKPQKALSNPHMWMLASMVVSRFVLPDQVHSAIRGGVCQWLSRRGV